MSKSNWLHKQIKKTEKSMLTWPTWMQKAAKLDIKRRKNK